MAGELGIETYDEKVKATRAKFIGRINDTLDEILRALTDEPASGSRESQARRVHRLLHDMAGNAAMLDLDSLSQKIRHGVDVAEKADEQHGTITPEDARAIRAVVEDARLIGDALSERV